MLVHDVLPSSSVYGPGKRWVLWVQGCTLACEGCWNVETWSRRSGQERTVSSLVEDIKANMEGLEGITVLGGEPLQQPDAVLSLMQQAKELGLTVMLYTGTNLTNTRPSCRLVMMLRTCSSVDVMLPNNGTHPFAGVARPINHLFRQPVTTTRRPSKTSKKWRSSSTTIRGKLR